MIKVIKCPYNECAANQCGDVEGKFEHISGASEAALHFPLDSNKKVEEIKCLTCGEVFHIAYFFRVAPCVNII